MSMANYSETHQHLNAALDSLHWLVRVFPALRRSGVAPGKYGYLGLLILTALFGCAAGSSQAPEDITAGVWAGDGGPDTFLFDLTGTDNAALTGTVHVMNAGKMTSQLTITRASYDPPNIEMFIEQTNATYQGRVNPSRGVITGGLAFGGQAGPEMELRWMDPAEIPGFYGLPGGRNYEYRTPAGAETEGWQTARPEDVGLTTAGIEAMVDATAQGQAGLIQSLLVVRDGKLVLEEYFHGFGPSDLHRVASVTKSVSSLLIGAAIDRRLIGDVSEPLADLLDLPAHDSWEGTTLDHLLTMSLGLDWTDQEASNGRRTGPTFFQEVMERKIVTPPGTRWEYVNANVNLLAGVLFNATGEHADRFARQALFDPLGISEFDWEYGKENGFNLMSGSLQLRPRDLAKIGAMVAAGGVWNGDRVISEEWITESTRTHIPTEEQPPALGGYGYLWWTGELPTRSGSQPMVIANGWGSQFIVVFPELEMVVVTTGGNEDNGRHLDFGTVLANTLLASM